MTEILTFLFHTGRQETVNFLRFLIFFGKKTRFVLRFFVFFCEKNCFIAMEQKCQYFCQFLQKKIIFSLTFPYYTKKYILIGGVKLKHTLVNLVRMEVDWLKGCVISWYFKRYDFKMAQEFCYFRPIQWENVCYKTFLKFYNFIVLDLKNFKKTWKSEF